MNFTIKDESGMTATELEITRLAIIEYLKPLSPWGFGDSEITINGEGVPIYITKRNRILSKGRFLSGYHTVENGEPVIYVNPKSDRFGYFRAGKAAIPARPARKVGLVTFNARPAVPARAGTVRAGQLSIIAHEVIETLGNPLIQNYSKPDELGRIILKEIADPVHGQNYNVVINGVNCILPNTCLPNWYELGSSAPYDVMGYCKKPFQLAPKGYANEVIFTNGVRSFKRI
jgi:hypothetical protein